VSVLKDKELMLLAELMKNSRRSDRGLARATKLSQPTVSRLRARLEKEGYVKEYTAIPDFKKLGYEILALTFLRLKKRALATDIDRIRKFAFQRLDVTPFDFIMFHRGTGLNSDGVALSLHKNYSAYTKLVNLLKSYEFIEDVQSYLIDINDKVLYLPLTMRVLADHLSRSEVE
jgi:DNA-binding Lrp family transcriptional regulator